jgi:hypothetical protein
VAAFLCYNSHNINLPITEKPADTLSKAYTAKKEFSMKLKKFRDMTIRHPWLREIMLEAASPFADTTERQLKDFITEKVEFISFRPFEKLNLHSAQWHMLKTPIKGAYDFNCIWESTSYRVYFWIGNEKLARARSISDEEPTVQDVILSIHDWYTAAVYKNQELGQLRWGFVLKLYAEGGVNGLVKVHYDIYEFPADFDASSAFPEYSV